ncbi:MAG: chromosomal replication initiator protein DnaA [Phycisphaerales bacterium]|jgi:chromosomal replication initiator protein|nr:chromosomal replication initiator protein DnaA [Phycisphaerales bacterium]
MSKDQINRQQLKVDLLGRLQIDHSTMCRRWFDDIVVLGIVDGTLLIQIKEPVQLKYLQRCCTQQFAEAAQSITGHLLGVRFVGEEGITPSSGNAVGSGGQGGSGVVSGDNPGGASVLSSFDIEEDLLISPDYNFENFVVGPGNRLAHAAATAVSTKPGQAYNPLFIYGGVGLGKTHLLQSICQTAIRKHVTMRIYYVSCNGFMTQFLEAVQGGKMSSFRNKFRAFDMLVIDDIHDLSKRDQTQEEFFHTFNTLFQSGKQLVLSSDAPPSEIPYLEERLISRFSCGLVASIDPPGFETRVAIIKKKAVMRNIDIPDDVTTYVASHLDSNIRLLEGAITTLQSVAMLDGADISLELAKRTIGNENKSDVPTNISIQNILDSVTVFYNIKLSDLLSKRRHKSITVPRQVGMWLSRKHTRFSLEEIGGYFGGRDHTTVMHAIKTIDNKIEGDEVFQREINLLGEQLSDKLGV